MPLNVRRIFASGSLILSGFALTFAQTAATPKPDAAANTNNTASPAATPAAPIAVKPAVPAPTSAEIMRERISKAKAFIAVKNYNAAIYEMENIRRETGDQTVHSVLNVLLMNSYLEQGDYKRAQDFLKELYNLQKSGKPQASPHYFAVAGQVVKGARSQAERYRALGLSVADRNLPLEASMDIEKMRETLEAVIEQSKLIGADKSKTSLAMPLLEEATASRGSLARDDYDARRWKDAVGDAREQMTNARSTVINAVTGEATPETAAPAISQNALASNTPIVNSPTGAAPTANNAPLFKPVASPNAAQNSAQSSDRLSAPENIASDSAPGGDSNAAPTEESKGTDADEKQSAVTTTPEKSDAARRTLRIVNAETNAANNAENKSATGANVAKNGAPVQMGSLLEFATRQAKPVYPAAARTTRQMGVVKLEVVVNEAGEVAEIATASGPSMLQSAARDAIKKWRFKPFTRDGQPVKAKGYVSFNFAL